MFDVAGKGKYFIDFKNGSGSVGEGDPGSKPDVTISMNEEVFLKIFNRKCRFILRKITINDYSELSNCYGTMGIYFGIFSKKNY